MRPPDSAGLRPTLRVSPLRRRAVGAALCVAFLAWFTGSAAQAATCGDGTLDPDETCEAPFDSCCDPSTCTFEPATTVCREGSGDGCDPDERCTGDQAACPADVVSPSGTVCNPGSGDPAGAGYVCDPDEVCSGTPGEACPADAFADAATVCRPGSTTIEEDVFVCDAAERCPGVADEACPEDVVHSAEDAVVLRSIGDTRIMETHRSSNNGAAALFWLKRSPHVRGIIGFDASCQASALEALDCGVLQMSIHDGIPTIEGSSFSASRMLTPWLEGNQAFDDFKSAGRKLGPFPGTGLGTTWGCRVDLDLADVEANNCPPEEEWLGGEACGEEHCYAPTTDVALYASGDQETLSWDLTSDLIGSPEPLSWLLKVADEKDINAGAVKLYQRDGARFIAETSPTFGSPDGFSLAPRLLLFGPGLQAPRPELAEPTSRQSVGSTIEVGVDQAEGFGPEAPRWENKTLGTWGYLEPGVVRDWEATIPLASGANEVEFTVFDSCSTEGRATYELTSAPGTFCGNGVVDPGEECDDGDGVSGDCCSGACTIESDGSPCDDGDVCTVQSACSAGTCTGGTPQPSSCGQSYLCYGTTNSRNTPPFLAATDVGLEDPFGPTAVDLLRSDALCFPGGIGGEPILDGSAHLLSYRMTERSSRPLPANIQITDRFATFRADAVRATGLLSAAAMMLDGPATPLPSGVVDSHECYSLRMKGGAFPQDIPVSLENSIESRSYVLRKPSRLCLAAEQGGGEVVNSEAHFLCYRAKRAPGQPKHHRVQNRIWTADPLGDLRLDTRRELEICVPASIDLPSL